MIYVHCKKVEGDIVHVRDSTTDSANDDCWVSNVT